ncbi:MAG TPA: gephyrin-like molybdotransferase Glp [Rhodothermales bacterium]|nr:gephyrin-like molybdotransferase Glp [Rhodothermales bacterium]
MKTVTEARALILQSIRPTPVEHVPLAEALGRTLAAEVVSSDTIPPFDNSAMDGFAVRAADVERVPVTLRVIERIHAGTFPSSQLKEGDCAQIMTGAPVPKGADAVVPVEWTDRVESTGGWGGERVTIGRCPEPGQHVRPAGGDVQAGALVFHAGQVVTPPVVGMLAALGYADVPVRSRPRVAVVATGDELAAPGQPLGPGQIRNSNGPALAAQVASAGGEARPPLVARDDPESVRAAVEQALEADVLILSGGVSVGEHDYVKQVLDELGLELLFWRVRQRPGKPLAFGLLRGKPVFGLPGNPVSSAVCFHQYVRPALAAMLGQAGPGPQLHTALLDTDIPKPAGLHVFARGKAYTDERGMLRVDSTGPQGSNVYSSFVQANCLIHLPEQMEQAPAGTPVQIEWLHW